MSATKTRGAGGAAGRWKADGNGETARPVHVNAWLPTRGRHAAHEWLTLAAAHRDEQAALASPWGVFYGRPRRPCRCAICRYVPRRAA